MEEEEELDFWTKLEQEREEKKRQEEESRRIIEQRKAEMKAKAEEAKKAARLKALKKKSGFMTPARKKKLRLLLRKKAAEELKKEQERKAAEKKAAILAACGQPKNLDNPKLGESDLRAICQEYHTRIAAIEGEKYDLEYLTKLKILEIKDLTRLVNEKGGRFIKPPMKKVPKFELTRPPPPKPDLSVISREKLKSSKKESDFDKDGGLRSKTKPEWALPKEQRTKAVAKKPKEGSVQGHPDGEQQEGGEEPELELEPQEAEVADEE